MTLIIKCAYCGKVLGTKEGGEGETHTVCKSCEKEQDRLLEEWLKEQKESKNASKNS